MSAMPSCQIADLFDTHQDEILMKWKAEVFAQQTLSQKGIDSDFFFKHFGSRILKYFITILRQENTPGSCPVIIIMLKFFKNYHISLDEIYYICSGKKNAVISFMLDHHIKHTEEGFKEVLKLFDNNFAGVTQEFIHQDTSSDQKTCAIAPIAFAGNKHTKPDNEQFCAEYGCEYDYSDLQEFSELEEEIISLSDKLLQGAETAFIVDELAQKFAKYSSTILINPTYIELAGKFFQLSELFRDSSNVLKIENDLQTYSLLLDCMINDLVIWRKNLLNNTVDTHYFDASLISNILQISRMLEEDLKEISDDTEIEFF